MSISQYFSQFKKNTREDLNSLKFYFSFLEKEPEERHWQEVDRLIQSLESSANLLKWQEFSRFWNRFRDQKEKWQALPSLPPALLEKIRRILDFLIETVEGLKQDSPLWKREEKAREILEEVFVLLQEERPSSPSSPPPTAPGAPSPLPSSPPLQKLAREMDYLSVLWEEYAEKTCLNPLGKKFEKTFKKLHRELRENLLGNSSLRILLLELEDGTLLGLQIERVDKILTLKEVKNLDREEKPLALEEILGKKKERSKTSQICFLQLKTSPSGRVLPFVGKVFFNSTLEAVQRERKVLSFVGKVLGERWVTVHPLSPSFPSSQFQGGALLPWGNLAFVLNPNLWEPRETLGVREAPL